MKTLFIEARSTADASLSKNDIEMLPKNICLASSVQFLSNIPSIKKQLEKADKKVTLFKGKHSIHPGQLLGCDIYHKDNIRADAFLVIGDGAFHPRTLAFKGKKTIFTFNPFSKKIAELKMEEADKVLKKIKINKKIFLTSQKIGIIISTKPGQNSLKKGLDLKRRLKSKEVFLFMADNIEFDQLENFPFIECWVNTACPRLALEDVFNCPKPIINISDLEPDGI